MLYSVVTEDLPQAPRHVCVLHHTLDSVGIIAVSYAASLYETLPGPSSSPLSGHPPLAHVQGTSSPLYFTIAELDLPITAQSPDKRLRVQHVPVPGVAVTSLALLRSADGSSVYVVVQSVARRVAPGESPVTTTHVYRRVVHGAASSASSSGGSSSDDTDNEEDESKRGARGAGEVSSSPPRVRYQRLPRPVEDDGRVWTAATAINPVESGLPPRTTAANGAAPTARHPQHVVAASGSGWWRQTNALQVIQVDGTRGRLQHTIELPVLSQFECGAVLPLPGLASHVLVRCHHAVVEVDLHLPAGVADPSAPVVFTSNEAVRRTWRWTPHDRITACCVKDHLLYAGTEEGVVLIWDTRQSSPDGEAPAPSRSAPTGVPITGIYAPYATDFVTCSLNGAVLAWRQGEQDGTGNQSMPDAFHFPEAAAAAAVAGGFPYSPSEPVSAVPSSAGIVGAEGCVGVAGDSNLLAVIGESGRLQLFWCA